MSLKGKKVAILAENDFEDLELLYPKLRLIEEGAEVVIAGLGEKEYCSKHGYPVQVDSEVKDLDTRKLDGVIIPGGWAPDRLRRSRDVLDLVKRMNSEGKVVASICHGGWVLASADIVRGRKLSCVVAIVDDMKNAGAKYEDLPVVVDGNLITSRTPPDLPYFCRAIIKALGE